MTEIQIFDVEGSGWRFGQDPDGTPWTVAADVAKSFDHSNTTVMLRMLDDDEKDLREVYTPGGPQQMKVVFEDGIWELIFRSAKPEAKAIKKRVKAILRKIRETGSYSIAEQEQKRLPGNYIEALRELADSEEEKEQLRAENAELKPSAHAWDVLASGKGDLSVADAAKILSRDPAIKIGERRLFTEMHDAGWLYRQRRDNRWRVYQTQIDNSRLSELPQEYEHPKTGELTLGAPQVRVKIKGLRELHHQLGGVAPLRFGEQLAIEGGG